MPEASITPGRRRLVLDPDTIAQPPRAPFVELGLVSCFSFLRGASEPIDLVETAWELGYDAIGVADANSMAGVVRIHTATKDRKSTRLNSSHVKISYAVFCLKKKKRKNG